MANTTEFDPPAERCEYCHRDLRLHWRGRPCLSADVVPPPDPDIQPEAYLDSTAAG